MIISGVAYLGLVRNLNVFQFRTKLLDRVSAASRDDIARGFDFMHRYNSFDTVSYNEMVLKFWKPLRASAFYADTSFLEKRPLDEDTSAEE